MKQAPHSWYEKIDLFFINSGFQWFDYDHNIYVLDVHGDNLIVEFYVDDLVIYGNNVDLILSLKKWVVDTFEMTNLGILHLFLGIKVIQINDGIFLSQPKYDLDVLKWFKMDDCKYFSTPYQLGVKLSKDCDSPQFDTTLYQQFLGIMV